MHLKLDIGKLFIFRRRVSTVCRNRMGIEHYLVYQKYFKDKRPNFEALFMKNRNFLQYSFIILKGMAMGAADVVPGVSGGTIAFISGIYEELITSINNINLRYS